MIMFLNFCCFFDSLGFGAWVVVSVWGRSLETFWPSCGDRTFGPVSCSVLQHFDEVEGLADWVGGCRGGILGVEGDTPYLIRQ